VIGGNLVSKALVRLAPSRSVKTRS
jgi:hypothetical protein